MSSPYQPPNASIQSEPPVRGALASFLIVFAVSAPAASMAILGLFGLGDRKVHVAEVIGTIVICLPAALAAATIFTALGKPRLAWRLLLAPALTTVIGLAIAILIGYLIQR